MIVSWIITFFLLSMTAGAQVPSADEIVSRAVERYSTFRSYQDIGVVLSYWPDQPDPDEIRFSTHFVRPDSFRFDWTSHHPYPPLRHLTKPYVIGLNRSGAFFYSGRPPKLKPVDSLGMAVARATGISLGSVSTIGRLLTPKTGTFGITITDLKALKVVATMDFEGVQCYQMSGTYPDGQPCVVWISTADYLIRKVERTVPRGRIEEIHRDIVIDGEIPAATFNFEPPR